MCVGRDRRLGGKKKLWQKKLWQKNCGKKLMTHTTQPSGIKCSSGSIQNDPLWSITHESDHTVRVWPGKKRDEQFFPHGECVKTDRLPPTAQAGPPSRRDPQVFLCKPPLSSIRPLALERADSLNDGGPAVQVPCGNPFWNPHGNLYEIFFSPL